MKKIWWFIKCVIGLGSIDDGSICWFSKKYWNIHDYPKHKGGDGYPCPFTPYHCPVCRVEFWI